MKTIARIFTAVAVALAFVLPAQALNQYQDQVAAQQHCPKDVVVWLNLPTMIWHNQGTRWYGMTKSGAYVCRKEAAVEGARGSRNGQ
jgi:hypothetical protein